MKRIKARLIGKGTRLDPWTVDLPTFKMESDKDVDGNPTIVDGKPIKAVDYTKKECYVLVLDDEVKPNGKLDQEKIRAKYKNWKDFNASDVEL